VASNLGNHDDQFEFFPPLCNERPHGPHCIGAVCCSWGLATVPDGHVMLYEDRIGTSGGNFDCNCTQHGSCFSGTTVLTGEWNEIGCDKARGINRV
jgi:hypothetical protein